MTLMNHERFHGNRSARSSEIRNTDTQTDRCFSFIYIEGRITHEVNAQSYPLLIVLCALLPFFLLFVELLWIRICKSVLCVNLRGLCISWPVSLQVGAMYTSDVSLKS